MTEEKRELAELLIENRLFLYTLLHRVFGREPDQQQLEILTEEHTGEAFGLLSETEGDPLDRAAGFLRGIREKLKDPAFPETVRGEYTRLFLGPASLPAPPWESVYEGTDAVLFQESTLEVRDFYRRFGLLPESYPRVADDSLALELAFMAALAGRMEEAFRLGDDGRLQETMAGSREFLEKHLLKWIPKFTERMAGKAEGVLYPPMCLVLESYLKRDAGILKEIAGWI